MDPGLQITRYPYEEPHHLQLVMIASNGRQRGEIEYYINTSDLIDMADTLERFPRHASDVYLHELGSERAEDRWAYHLKFRLFTTDPVGHCAIHLRFSNNKNVPDREVSEFCIPAEPAALNRLGNLFREFARLKHEVLCWTPMDGRLYEKREEAEQCSGTDAGSPGPRDSP